MCGHRFSDTAPPRSSSPWSSSQLTARLTSPLSPIAATASRERAGSKLKSLTRVWIVRSASACSCVVLELAIVYKRVGVESSRARLVWSRDQAVRLRTTHSDWEGTNVTVLLTRHRPPG
eukprot:2562763-Prymnesium_polylepis.2